MNWARILAFVTGMVDKELLARSEYLVAENRILKAVGHPDEWAQANAQRWIEGHAQCDTMRWKRLGRT